MEDDLRAIEYEPANSQPDDDRDVDGFAESGFGSLVVERVEKVDQFMLFEFAVAVGTHLDGRGAGRRAGFGRSLERRHELCCRDGCGTLKLRWQRETARGGAMSCVPVYVVPSIFSSLGANYGNWITLGQLSTLNDLHWMVNGSFSVDMRAVVLDDQRPLLCGASRWIFRGRRCCGCSRPPG